MTRRLGVAVLLLVVLAAGTVLGLRWPSSKSALECPPGEVHLDERGVARCGPGRALRAEQVLTAGGTLHLNQASADELAAIAGVGPQLALALVEARGRLDGGFRDWDEVDRVPGVGAARLETLKATADLR